MKWDKALTYLIIMFLCVNIGLGIGNYNRNVLTYKLSDKRVQNITKILKDNNITIKAKLPTYFKPLPSIWTLPTEITPSVRDDLVRALLGASEEGVVVTKELGDGPYEKVARVYTKGSKVLKFKTNNIYYENYAIKPKDNFLTESKAKAIAEEFVKGLKIPKNSKKIKIEYKNESYGASVTYYEVYDKVPLFGSYMHLKMTAEGVFLASIHGNTVESKANAKTVIYPIDKVLFALKDEFDKKETIIIEDIMLGYAILNQVEMHILKEEAIPVYKITIQGLDKPIFVNAYTNTVEELTRGSFYK